MSNPFVDAMTRAATNRKTWPPFVLCRRNSNPLAASCCGHDDCRVEHWRLRDERERLLSDRPIAPRRKKRP